MTVAEGRPVIFPQALRFTCHMCSGCCRHWNVVVTEEEAARFRDFDWAASRSRFQGRETMKPTDSGQYQLSHIGDACIFLDDDDLCAIHKELGLAAKPRMCRQFPYQPVDTPEGIVASFDFACPSVVRDEGAPIQEQEAEFRAVVAEAPEKRAEGARAGTGTGDRPSPPPSPRRGEGVLGEVSARRGVPLAWADYLALERALLGLLEDEERPLTARALLVDALLRQAGDHAARGSMELWLEGLQAAGWEPLAPTRAPLTSAFRQRALIAPVIGGMEQGWKQALGGKSTVGGRVGLALAVASSQRPVRLETADATVDLARMPRTRFVQDDPRVTGALARFLVAFIVRKGLMDGTSLAQGGRYLAVYFGVIRWYAVARAVLAGREAVQEADVHYAIALAEKALSHTKGLKSPTTAGFVNLLFTHVAPASALYPSPYPE